MSDFEPDRATAEARARSKTWWAQQDRAADAMRAFGSATLDSLPGWLRRLIGRSA